MGLRIISISAVWQIPWFEWLKISVFSGLLKIFQCSSICRSLGYAYLILWFQELDHVFIMRRIFFAIVNNLSHVDNSRIFSQSIILYDCWPQHWRNIVCSFQFCGLSDKLRRVCQKWLFNACSRIYFRNHFFDWRALHWIQIFGGNRRLFLCIVSLLRIGFF